MGAPGSIPFKYLIAEKENEKLKKENERLKKEMMKLEKKIKNLEENVKKQKSVSYKFLTHKLALLNKIKNPNAKPKPSRFPRGLYKKHP